MSLIATSVGPKGHARKTVPPIGQRFGRLIVLGWGEPPEGFKSHDTRFLQCKCDCGVEKSIGWGSITGGGTVSCGCYHSQVMITRNSTHGLSKLREYGLWNTIRGRCLNPNVKCYPRYGGRGIRVCERWVDSFENFYLDMGPKPEGKSIDRIDNDGDYEPKNCRWATPSEQTLNSCRGLRITAFGKTMSSKEWAEESGIKPSIIRERLANGWSAEDAVSRLPHRGPPRKENRREK